MTAQTRQCPECNTGFSCDPEQVQASCWCYSYPAFVPVEAGQTCRCPNCLANLVGETIESHLNSLSREEALILASRYRNDRTLIENIDYTIESGNLVFSRWYHLKRGSCCGNRCRHCPYK